MYLSISEDLGCFHFFLAVVSNTAMNMLEYVSNSLGYISRNGIAGSCASLYFSME